MGIEIRFTADGIGMVWASTGLLTGRDLLDADTRLRDEVTSGRTIRYLLVDHSAIPEESIESGSIQILAEQSEESLELIPDGVVAVVAPNDVLFGLSRMWEQFVEYPRLTTRVMRSRDEAIAWLQDELAERELPFRLTD